MAFKNNPDQDWQVWAQTNPYFGVITDPKFLSANLNHAALAEFFETGERHVDHIYDTVRRSIQPDFQPARALDYGCGVGRLLIPIAQRSQSAVGVDVSNAMLETARENCARLHVLSARLVHADQMATLDPGSFDFIHSFIVFQHIPVARGLVIFTKLIALLAEGGVGAIQFTYSNKNTLPRRAVAVLQKNSTLIHGLVNLIKRQPFSTPLMQMNSYSLDRIFNILADAHCSNIHVEFSKHGPVQGVMLYFQKKDQAVL